MKSRVLLNKKTTIQSRKYLQSTAKIRRTNVINDDIMIMFCSGLSFITCSFILPLNIIMHIGPNNISKEYLIMIYPITSLFCIRAPGPSSATATSASPKVFISFNTCNEAFTNDIPRAAPVPSPRLISR